MRIHLSLGTRQPGLLKLRAFCRLPEETNVNCICASGFLVSKEFSGHLAVSHRLGFCLC